MQMYIYTEICYLGGQSREDADSEANTWHSLIIS